MRLNIHFKIMLVFGLIFALVLAGIFLYLDSFLKDYTYQRIRSALIKETLLVRMFLERDFPGYTRLKTIDALIDETGGTLRARTTVIAPDGEVLGDSDLDGPDLKGMENHLYRPEVQQALREGLGESHRFSTTLQKDMLYIASVFGIDEPVGVVRLSLPLSEIDAVSDRLKRTLIVALIIAFLLTLGASMVASSLISKPLTEVSALARDIARGDLSKRISFTKNDEVGDLAEAVNHMADQIDTRIREITRSRTRFEAVLLNMFEGVMVVDLKGDIMLMNPELMSALKVESNPARKKPLEVLRNIDVQEMVDRVLASEKRFEEGEISILFPEEKIYKVHGTPIICDGKNEGAVLVFHDITTLRRLEEVRKDFVANVSHELRTPIASIKGYAETLLDGALDDTDNAREFVQIINMSSERLAMLIEDLLSLSAIEEGKTAFEMVPFSLAELTGRIVKGLMKKAEDKHIDMKVDLPSGLPEVMGDEVRISQVLLNLIDNALKYTKPGGKVHITACVEDDMVRVEVKDTGIGIPGKHLPRIFERFYRADKARSRQMGGTGLGLSIVKHIVLEHGGSVDASSVENEGSTFSFTMPLA